MTKLSVFKYKSWSSFVRTDASSYEKLMVVLSHHDFAEISSRKENIVVLRKSDHAKKFRADMSVDLLGSALQVLEYLTSNFSGTYPERKAMVNQVNILRTILNNAR